MSRTTQIRLAFFLLGVWSGWIFRALHACPEVHTALDIAVVAILPPVAVALDELPWRIFFKRRRP